VQRLAVNASRVGRSFRTIVEAVVSEGALGAALLQRLIRLRWAKVSNGSRVVRFSEECERALRRALAVEKN
jgi:hypothetical protein